MDVAAPPHAPISAPPSARVPLVYDPDLHDDDGGAVERATEKVGDLLSGRAHDLWSKALSSVNKVIFRSRPGGAPVPRDPTAWTFAAIGDYGGGTNAQTDVAANILRSKPSLVLTLGDNVYSTGAEREWKKYFDPDKYFGAIRREIPVYPTLGNHDVEVPPDAYFRRFPELGGARYYSFEQGGVHFAALDSNEPLEPGSPQYEWLDRDLAANPDEWKVVYLHHPVYSGVPKRWNNRLRETLAPLLARRGVDLVLVGHEHWYERSKALEGTHMVQATVGAGGKSVVPFVFPQEPWNQYREVSFGHLEVEVGASALVGRYVRRDGTIADTFTVKRPAADAVNGAALVRPTSVAPSDSNSGG